MDSFKNELRKRLTLMTVVDLLATIFIILTSIYGYASAASNADMSDMIHGFQTGIFVGVQIVLLRYIPRYRRALKNDIELKELYIEENDERTKLIKDKIGGTGFNFSLGAIATAAVMSGFFNITVFATLCIVLVFMAFVKGFLKMHYRRKF